MENLLYGFNSILSTSFHSAIHFCEVFEIHSFIRNFPGNIATRQEHTVRSLNKSHFSRQLNC